MESFKYGFSEKITQYNTKMITKYKKVVQIQSKFIKYCGYTKILSAKLNIQNDPDLQQLGFVEYLKITDLQIKQCQIFHQRVYIQIPNKQQSLCAIQLISTVLNNQQVPSI
ncbi:Hypothetical_protein [Hexamita inflata]|uniref:Hypothetical_protein n=1 Tax=Hexamita inflata TaxID=28002 RepID=A0AA86R232_9EUKA|nr:Hypothetical protein HINF_LOCUS52133 [Hexamita inflata]